MQDPAEVGQAQEEAQPKDLTLEQILRKLPGDTIKIIAVSAGLAYFGITKSCVQLPKQIGIELGSVSDLQAGLLALDVGAGVFAGYTNRHIASVGAYTISILPELHQIFSTGNLEESGKMLISKTFVYGGAYVLGYFFRN